MPMSENRGQMPEVIRGDNVLGSKRSEFVPDALQEIVYSTHRHRPT